MSNDKMDWNAIKDLLDHYKIMKTKFHISAKVELFIPIELMKQAIEYAKSIQLDVELRDLDEFQN